MDNETKTERLEKYFEGYKVIENDEVIGRVIREVKGANGTSIKWLSILSDGKFAGESSSRQNAIRKLFKAHDRRNP